MDIPVDNTYRNQHDKYELVDSFSAVSNKSEKLKNEAKQVLKPIVVQNYVSVFTKVMYVLKKIRHGETVEIKALYRGQNRSAQVATFLALLELSKHSRVEFSEDGEYLTMMKRKEAADET